MAFMHTTLCMRAMWLCQSTTLFLRFFFSQLTLSGPVQKCYNVFIEPDERQLSYYYIILNIDCVLCNVLISYRLWTWKSTVCACKRWELKRGSDRQADKNCVTCRKVLMLYVQQIWLCLYFNIYIFIFVEFLERVHYCFSWVRLHDIDLRRWCWKASYSSINSQWDFWVSNFHVNSYICIWMGKYCYAI